MISAAILSLAMMTQFGQPLTGGVNFNRAQTIPMPLGIYNLDRIIRKNVIKFDRPKIKPRIRRKR